ncbi:MAG: hypothetical protein N2484_15505, partial [Clostridia bacterium]|nr:hypothetical protein [Clostridia bacterium]
MRNWRSYFCLLLTLTLILVWVVPAGAIEAVAGQDNPPEVVQPNPNPVEEPKVEEPKVEEPKPEEPKT